VKFRLDHIGLVVENIDRFAQLLKTVGFEEFTDPIADPTQMVSASFVNTGNADDVYIELLEPTHEKSPILNFLKKGGGLHHLCFEVADIERTTEELLAKGFTMVCAPVECSAYDVNLKRDCEGITRIAFFIVSRRFLIELIEKGR
jgi:methylmalonyl-CoA/ethylmalonyl-CoA epimerase